MSFKENPHFHQSDLLQFLPIDYTPLTKGVNGETIYGVLTFTDGWKVKYQKQKPQFGGYLSKKESIYGNTSYCPNATRNHKKHLKQFGSMPHLVYFDSEKTALKANFRKCQVCND